MMLRPAQTRGIVSIILVAFCAGGLKVNPGVPETFAEFEKMALQPDGLVFFWTSSSQPDANTGRDKSLAAVVNGLMMDVDGLFDNGGPHVRNIQVSNAVRDDLSDPRISRHLEWCRRGILDRHMYMTQERIRNEVKRRGGNRARGQKAQLTGVDFSELPADTRFVSDSGYWDWRFCRIHADSPPKTKSGKPLHQVAEEHLRQLSAEPLPTIDRRRWLYRVQGVNVYPAGGFREWHTDKGNHIGWRMYISTTPDLDRDRGGLGVANPLQLDGSGNFTFLEEGPEGIVLFRVNSENEGVQPFWHCIASPNATRHSIGFAFWSEEAAFEVIRRLFGDYRESPVEL